MTTKYVIFHAKLLRKYIPTLVWQPCDSCQNVDMSNFQNNLTWPNSNTPEISIDSGLKYSKITGLQKAAHSPGSCAENFPLVQISSILCINFISSVNARVISSSCTSGRHVGRLDCLVSRLILIKIYNGTGYSAWRQSVRCPTKPTEELKKLKMYAIKQIKICTEYQYILPKPRLVVRYVWPSDYPDKPALAWVACPGILHRS